MHRTLEDLRDKLNDELEKINKKASMGPADLEAIHKLTDTIKNIDKICIMDMDGYSGAGDWEARGHFGDMYSRRNRDGRNGGNSYARGRERNARRDSRGRYSRDNGYSYDDAKEDLVDELKDLMHDAPDAETKHEFKKFIDKIEDM